VRFLGAADHPNAVGLFTISGNMIGSQARAIDLQGCRGVVITGNTLYCGYRALLWAERCEHLVIGPNSIDHNPDYGGRSTDQVVLRGCRNVALTGLVLQHTREPSDAVTASLEVRDCENVNITGAQVIGARGRGIAVENSSVVRIADCTIRGGKEDRGYRAALTVDERCTQVMVCNNFL